MGWDGKLRSLTIDSESSPELFQELKALSGRARGERLRSLALIGLTVLKSNTSVAVSLSPVEKEKKIETGIDEKKNAARRSLRDKLTSGLLNKEE